MARGRHGSAAGDGYLRAMNIETIIKQQLLDVVFQPIRNLRTMSIVGFEALGRVRPEALGAFRRALGPTDWLDLAHRQGCLLALDRAWRRCAIEHIASVEVAPNVVFFLNVDTRIVDDPRFGPDFTTRQLRRLGIRPQRIVLELSERHSQLGEERLAALVPHYASQGYRVALDDLGAGHASLCALVNLQPHIVKLDRGLVQGVGASHARWHLVKALVEFARHTSTQLVAEGIETAEDAAALVQAGMEYGQGYYLGLPRPLADFRREAQPARPRRLPHSAGSDARALPAPASRSRVEPSHIVTVWPEATNEGTMVN